MNNIFPTQRFWKIKKKLYGWASCGWIITFSWSYYWLLGYFSTAGSHLLFGKFLVCACEPISCGVRQQSTRTAFQLVPPFHCSQKNSWSLIILFITLRLLLYCSHHNNNNGKYGFIATSIAIVTLSVLFLNFPNFLPKT